jgi:hypothetical protein
MEHCPSNQSPDECVAATVEGYCTPYFEFPKYLPHMRTITVHLIVGLLCLGTTAMAQTADASLPTFVDAERRIVYNKANGLPKYDGVSIQYAFRLTSETGWSSAEDLTSTVSGMFTDVISATIVREGSEVLLLVLTDGNVANHTTYNDVLAQYGTSLERARQARNYFLK